MGDPFDIRVVGLDLALRVSGCAYANGDVAAFKTKGTGMGRVGTIVDHVMCVCEGGAVDLVAIEGYSMGSKGRAILDLAELGGIVRYRLYCARVPFIEVPPQTLKIYATGTAKSDKFAMVDAAQKRLAYAGHQPDEADALWLRAYGLAKLDCPLVKLPATHLRALDALALPDPPSGAPPWPHASSNAALPGTTSPPGNGH